jgi:hypothetical protein
MPVVIHWVVTPFRLTGSYHCHCEMLVPIHTSTGLINQRIHGEVGRLLIVLQTCDFIAYQNLELWTPGSKLVYLFLSYFTLFSYTVPLGLMADWCMSAPSRRYGGTRHHCNICGKSYGHQTSLVHHQKVHSGETTCAICNKVLNRTFDLKMHLSFVHGITESNPE